jgi:hypothetical protein
MYYQLMWRDGVQAHILCNCMCCKQHPFFDFPICKTQIISVPNDTKIGTLWEDDTTKSNSNCKAGYLVCIHNIIFGFK